MMVKSLLAGAIAASLLVGLAACSKKSDSAGSATPAAGERIKVALIVKSLGNGFFDAAHEGAKQAAAELGNVDIIYTGPTTPSAEGQIDILNSQISQKVNAIVISANDPNALVPIAQKAMQRGIKVISFDSGLAKEGRLMQLNPSGPDLIARKQLEMAASAIGGSGAGEIAILSASAQATNQNLWIDKMKALIATPEFNKLKLVATVYGDDQSDKSYREAIGLLRANPNLKVIIAPTTVGIVAAAKAVVDEKLVGKVYVTGLGLPSEMAGHVHSGAVKEFAIWNPIDLGYGAIYAAVDFVKNAPEAKAGGKVNVGRLGKIDVDANGEAALAPPFVYNKDNVDQFAKIF